jgi:glycine cleavage system aminomethyltransferase T
MSVGNDALQARLRGRGAVMVTRGGASVAAHFGSAAGELAACVRGVGIANRSDLGKLVVTGPHESVQMLARRHAGVELARGGVAELTGGWWCADAVDRLILVVARELRAELYEALGQEARAPGVTICDASETLASVAIAGRRMRHLLAALGIVSPNCDLRGLAPFSPVELEGSRVYLLLQSDDRALLIMDGAHADVVWQALEAAGRPLDLSLVGLEALERFALFEKMHVVRTVSG